MNPVSEDIKDLLVSNSVGTFASKSSSVWGIFCFEEPKNTKKTISVLDLPGSDGFYSVNRQEAIRNESFMIMVTHYNYRTAWDKLQSIDDIINDKSKFNLNGSTYHTIKKESDFMFNGRDDNNNFMLSANYFVYRTNNA